MEKLPLLFFIVLMVGTAYSCRIRFLSVLAPDSGFCDPITFSYTGPWSRNTERYQTRCGEEMEYISEGSMFRCTGKWEIKAYNDDASAICALDIEEDGMIYCTIVLDETGTEPILKCSKEESTLCMTALQPKEAM